MHLNGTLKQGGVPPAPPQSLAYAVNAHVYYPRTESARKSEINVKKKKLA